MRNIELTRVEVALIQGALSVAMNEADNAAGEASMLGDDYAIKGKPERAFAYHERARVRRNQSAEMHKLFTRLVREFGDLRRNNVEL